MNQGSVLAVADYAVHASVYLGDSFGPLNDAVKNLKLLERRIGQFVTLTDPCPQFGVLLPLALPELILWIYHVTPPCRHSVPFYFGIPLQF